MNGRLRQRAYVVTPEEHRDFVLVQNRPSRLLEHPLRQPSIGLDPDQIDPVAVAHRVPGRAAGEDINVFEDRFLAVKLEPVVEVGRPNRPALGLDQAAPVLLVEEAR